MAKAKKPDRTHKVEFTLSDDAGGGKKAKGIVEVGPYMIQLRAKGYGDCGSADGHGSPVAIEFYGGKLRVLIWGDINKEDPTHTIELEGAREDARKDR